MHEISITETKRRRSTGQQLGAKNARGPGDKPVINRSSTGRCVRCPVYRGFPFFVPPKRRPGWLSSVPWVARWTVFSWAHRPAAVLGASTRRHPIPLHRAPPRRRRRRHCGIFARRGLSTENP